MRDHLTSILCCVFSRAKNVNSRKVIRARGNYVSCAMTSLYSTIAGVAQFCLENKLLTEETILKSFTVQYD